MLKKLTLVLALLQVGTLTVFSQQSDETVLRKMAAQIKDAQEKNYAFAVRLAAEKGWPLSIDVKNGGIIKLTGVDYFGNPVYTSTFNNIVAAATTKTNQLWPGGSSGLNLSGSSDAVKGKIASWDGGSPLTTHVELSGRIVSKDGAIVSDHSTYTSGTLIARGVNPLAKGMAFGAQQLISYDFTNDAAEMTLEAPNLLISNHSYGNLAGWNYDGTSYSWYGDTTIARESYLFGYYNTSAQLYDSIAYNAPFYLICVASGNSRGDNGPAVGTSYKYNGSTTVTRVNINNNPDYGSVPGNAGAKNVLLVGAINALPNGYQTIADPFVADFSSSGPTDDGRIKPDIVGDGVDVLSSSSASNTSYETSSGTSAATPNVTGSLYLLQEYYTRLHPGSFMRSSTLKALAIHTADDAGPVGPDYHYGWGVLNSLRAANVITSSFNHRSDTLIEKTLDNAANATYSINVTASGNGKLYATIVWNDPPAIVNSNKLTVLNDPTPKLIHDLDLRIIKQSDGTIFKPWVLNPIIPSLQASTGDDALNNVEQVVVDGAIPGQTYTIQVTHKGTLARSTQPFSLIVSGIGGVPYCTSVATSNAGTRIDSVGIANIANKNVAGCTTYNSFTNLTVQLEPNKTYPITIKLSSCDASTNSRVVKVYIDYNSDGAFNESTELVASGSVAGGSQTFTGNITTPAVIVGNAGLMRVVVQETTNAASVTACNSYTNGETQDYKVFFINASNDLSLAGINVPTTSGCASNSQLIQVVIRNLGTATKANAQIVAVIKNGTVTVTTITGTYPLAINAGVTVNYTLQTPFASTASTTYTIVAYIIGNSDQVAANDTASTTFTTASKPATPTGAAEICGSSVYLQASNVNPSANYFWYSATPLTSPIATGSFSTSNTISSQYFLQTGYRGNIGLTTKNGNGTGNYQIGGNYLTYTSTVPLVLESARLFTRGFGTITFIPADFDAQGNGTYAGNPVDVNVYPTNPNYLTDASSVNDPADTGAIFYIGLTLPVGSHSIYAIATDTILFRNNGLVTNFYPFTIPNVISITGNSANSTNYYYYLYNMTVATSDCISDPATIVPITAPTPVITQSGSSLTSSIGSGNQWYLNGSPIPGASGSTFTPTQSGNYSVIVTDNFGCQKGSNTVAFVFTAVQTVPAAEISLTVMPNPNNGIFIAKMHFNTTVNLQLDLINAQGQSVLTKSFKNIYGDFSNSVNASSFASGIYMLRITDGKKAYYEKVVLAR